MENNEQKTLRTLSVYELTVLIKMQLESRFPAIRVQGEVSNFVRQTSGHCYFTLKDKDASLSCTLFKSQSGKIPQIQNGDRIFAAGAIRVYEPRGAYQLNVVTIEPFGLGDLYLLFEDRKKKYQELGYFADQRKRLLKPFIRRIGLITSATGAVLQDILHVLERRSNLGLQILMYPVRVQGPLAAEEIAKAIQKMNQETDCEVLILARGGGSFEDLFCFNEEIVIEAIFQSRIPVVSAIGHETDFTLSDFVADLRAPTPSAAAEMVGPSRILWLSRVNQLSLRLDAAYRGEILLRDGHVKQLGFKRMQQLWQNYQEFYAQKLDRLSEVLHNWPQKLQDKMSDLKHKKLHLQVLSLNFVQALQLKIQALGISLGQALPMSALVLKDGEPIEKAENLNAGTELELLFKDGQVSVKVTQTLKG